MYMAVVFLFMLVFPLLSIVGEVFVLHTNASLLMLVGKWFVFWAVGMRLFTAGIRQVITPQLTTEDILGLKQEESHFFVRELGFANIAMGLVGICSILNAAWVLPASLAGGVFFGLAGINHLLRKDKNRKEWLAAASDLWIFLICMGYFLLMIFYQA